MNFVGVLNNSQQKRMDPAISSAKGYTAIKVIRLEVPLTCFGCDYIPCFQNARLSFTRMFKRIID